MWARSGILAAVLFCAFFHSVASAVPPPLEAFATLPAAKMAKLSPDGHRLAVIRPINGFEQVMFLDLTTPNSTPYVVGQAGAMADQVIWKDATHAICFFSSSVEVRRSTAIVEHKAVFDFVYVKSVDVGAHAEVQLMPGSLQDTDANDPIHIYMTGVHDKIYGLFSVDIVTGKAELLHAMGAATRYITDGYGAFVGVIDVDRDLTRHVFVNEKEIMQIESKGGSDLQLVGLTAGDKLELVEEKPSAFGTKGLYAWTPAAGETTLYENPNFDVDGVFHDERNGRVIGFSYQDDLSHCQFFDPALQRVQRSLEKAFPGQSVCVVSHDVAGSAFVVVTEGPKNPPVLSLYTPGNHQVNIIENDYEGLGPDNLGDVKVYNYKARDGLDIHAYLTLPPGRTAQNLPLVVFPHGGPEERDSLEFSWWAQFMATRGYAVFQPNFRGSAGYGTKFIHAGDGEWAGKVQYDVQDGVHKLIADGIVDPKRICIVGASYGGYMALAGATYSPDLYACAISYAGVSDLRSIIRLPAFWVSEGISIWKRRIGADKDSDKADDASPARAAAQVKIPILLLHGDRDTTVAFEQSVTENDALKEAGKQVEFVKLQGDDHYMEFASTRIQLLKEVDRFLASHIGDKTQQASVTAP
jgi:dipeptidyl aminopeptidase/acylaminoacyl peptidase